MNTRYLEDFTPGERFETRGATLTEGAIVDFALAYDPQPMHVDASAAAEGPFGGLIASGFHGLALSFRLFVDLGLVVGSNIVGPGLDNLRWLLPLRPGDTIRSTIEVLEARPSASKPDRGIVRFGFTVRNQMDDVVITYESVSIMRRRPGA